MISNIALKKFFFIFISMKEIYRKKDQWICEDSSLKLDTFILRTLLHDFHHMNSISWWSYQLARAIVHMKEKRQSELSFMICTNLTISKSPSCPFGAFFQHLSFRQNENKMLELWIEQKQNFFFFGKKTHELWSLSFEVCNLYDSCS